LKDGDRIVAAAGEGRGREGRGRATAERVERETAGFRQGNGQ
jgi:hypothetical protein